MFLYDELQTECFECLAHDNLVDDVKYWFTCVLEQLYGQEKFSSENLEHYLNEMCAYLKMKMPQRELNVQEKPKSVNGNVSEPEWLLNYAQVLTKSHYENLKTVGA